MTRDRTPTASTGILQIALRRTVVRRALRYGVIVGVLLIGINHGGALLSGPVTAGRMIQMALTLVVPYLVSTLSSVESALEGGSVKEEV